MNSNSFLLMITEKLKLVKDNPVKMYSSDGKVVIEINKETWMGDTFDQCITDIKQSFAIKYLEDR